jgi:predicted aldo/keto reductase-like oxidoreductase
MEDSVKDRKNMNRREFFSKTAAGAAGIGMAGLWRSGSLEAKTDPQVETSAKSAFITRTLGKTGITLPVVSMGVMNARNPDLVRRSLERGIRHLDTAFVYGDGQNESMVGQVVADMKLRDRVVIATKEMVAFQRRGLSGAKAAEALIKMVEASLKRLQSDYIDIVYIHDVTTPEDAVHPGFQEGFRKLKEQGKIKFAGFSTHMNMAACIDAAVKNGSADVILTSFNFALSNDTVLLNSLKNAAAKGVGLVAMKTQCSQDWYRGQLPQDQQKFYGGNIVHKAVLKWVLNHPFITTAVPGFTTFQQIDDDVTVAYDLAYKPDEIQYLKDKNVQMTLNTCVQCGRCSGTCPGGVDLPALMRTHMYVTCYGNLRQAKHTLDCIPATGGIARCAACGECEATCVRGLPVAERIGEMKTLLG